MRYYTLHFKADNGAVDIVVKYSLRIFAVFEVLYRYLQSSRVKFTFLQQNYCAVKMLSVKP